MRKLFVILIIASMATACAAGTSTVATSPANSLVVQQLGTLNAIAVGVAVVGGLAGLLLSIMRRKHPDDEPEAAPPAVKVTSKTSKKNKKKRK